MRILLVNKFLYEKGGAETYVLSLGNYFKSIGHEVQFFGMKHERNVAGNDWNLITNEIDFHKKSLAMLFYPFKIIYSLESRRKIKKLIKLFKPDIAHLNNINFQITPSIIYELKKQKIPIVFTTHDLQLICPGHLLYQQHTQKVCEECVTRGFFRCVANNCIHGSKLRSILGFLESSLYHGLNTYSLIDQFVCPSKFNESKLLVKPVFRGKTTVLNNAFKKPVKIDNAKKGNYILYFGRFSAEKGIITLLKAIKKLPEFQFVLAGSGPLEHLIKDIPNINYVGFLSGDSLVRAIAEARFSISPSECYENYPYSVMESITYGTPVIGAEIGGIPEIIKNNYNGLLFQSANPDDLVEKIKLLWNDNKLLEELSKNCLKTEFVSEDSYGNQIIEIFKKVINSK